MASDLDYYRTQSRWTDPGRWASLLAEIPPEPTTLPRDLARLLLHPFVAPQRGVEVPATATTTATSARSRRCSIACTRATPARWPPNGRRSDVFCVCAGFARVAAAVLRHHAMPARCRAGFAAYFTPGFLEDHWVCEYWDGSAWRLLDAQLDDTAVRELGVGFAPWDVPRDQFLDAATAWRRLRAGELDPSRMGLSALGLAGTWFAVGELMLDAAALNKDEMLPWEKWSIGRDCGPGSATRASRWPSSSTRWRHGCAARRTRRPPGASTASTVAAGDSHGLELRQRRAGRGRRALTTPLILDPLRCGSRARRRLGRVVRPHRSGPCRARG